MKKGIIILGILFLINLILATSVGIIDSDITEGRVVYVPPISINYSLVPTVNSSDFWDDLDVPTDISGSEYWYNHTSDVFGWVIGNYVPYTGATTNVDLGIYNFTTTGTGTFGDLIASNFYVGGKSIVEPESPTPYGVDNTGLVGYWSANGNALDFSGYGNDGTLFNDATYSDGVFGTGFEFDGDGEYVEISADPSIANFTEITLAVWFKTNDNTRTYQRLISKAQNWKGNGEFILYLENDDFYISFVNDSGTERKSSWVNQVQNDVWYHVVATYNGSIQKLYIDSVERDSDVHSGNLSANEWIRISDPVVANSVNGTIDEVMIFNRSLSAGEIQALYNSGNKLYSEGNNLTYPNDVTIGGILHAGIIKLLDNVKLFFGSADDASIYYDGNDLIINPKEVGSGSANILGRLNINSTDGSDQIGIYHDNTQPIIKWDDGDLLFISTESTNANTFLDLRPQGTGVGAYRIDTVKMFEWKMGDARVNVIAGGQAGIRYFGTSPEGTTQEFQISGFRTGDVRRRLEIGVGIDANDTVSFDGVSNYYFDGNVGIFGDLNVTGTIFTSALNISNSSFSFSDNENSSIKYSVENKNSGSNATALMTAMNDVGGIMGIGIGSSNYLLGSLLMPNITGLYSRSRGDSVFLNFYKQAFIWMFNPSDDNDPNNLVQVMRLDENGLNVSGNIISNNSFISQYIFAHNNATMILASANVWANLTFDQEDAEIKKGISHTFNDNTNHTFTINEDGIYDIDFNFDVIDTSASSTDIDVAGRVIYSDGTEITGSVFETDITKKNIETEISHSLLAEFNDGDKIVFQFVAADVDVEISTHGTFGDHPESATIRIEKVANL